MTSWSLSFDGGSLSFGRSIACVAWSRFASLPILVVSDRPSWPEIFFMSNQMRSKRWECKFEAAVQSWSEALYQLPFTARTDLPACFTAIDIHSLSPHCFILMLPGLFEVSVEQLCCRWHVAATKRLQKQQTPRRKHPWEIVLTSADVRQILSCDCPPANDLSRTEFWGIESKVYLNCRERGLQHVFPRKTWTPAVSRCSFMVHCEVFIAILIQDIVALAGYLSWSSMSSMSMSPPQCFIMNMNQVFSKLTQ